MFDPKIVVAFFAAIVGGLIAGSFSYWTTRLNLKNQWALVAMEKRLQAHQEAFSLWYAICSSLSDQTVFELALRAEEWWKDNCLYLDAKSRHAFKLFPHAVRMRHELLSQTPRDTQMLLRVWEEIQEPGSLLAEGVGLPNIKDVFPNET
ncbi:MAG: hypothetical protein OXR72_05495 [Gemmatimonadota bacterium]|nr:hypothetical protein [Gemmatimonadota bacterium]